MKTDIYDSFVKQIEEVEDPDLKEQNMAVLKLIPKEEWEQFEQPEGKYLLSRMCVYSMEVTRRMARDAMRNPKSSTINKVKDAIKAWQETKADPSGSSDNSDGKGAS